MRPRYPIYVPSKKRSDTACTPRYFEDDDVPYFLVVEPQERDTYSKKFPLANLLVLPGNDRGIVYARNWIRDHATESGAERHWQIDDNIKGFSRFCKGKRVPANSGIALRVCEDFADRYENVALAGLNYDMFAPATKGTPPFRSNVHVYSCTLFLNSLPNRFRGFANEDVDMCLQVLAGGWCTVLLNCFTAKKATTMTMRGGNTHVLYRDGDSRLKVSRHLERRWPGVVTVDRRYGRPHHVITASWRKFTTPLKLKPGVRLEDFQKIDEYGMELVQKKKIKSSGLKKYFKRWNKGKEERT